MKDKKEKNRKDIPSEGSTPFGAVGAFCSRLFYIYSLVWHAAPLMLVALVALCLLDGLLPVFGAYISSFLLNAIADGIGVGTAAESVMEIMRPLIWLFVMYMVYLFLTKVLNRINVMVTGIAGELVINKIKLMIMGKAKEVDISSFDDPEFYEKLENANREAGVRPINIINASFSVISAVISAISFVVVLATLSPLAPIVIVIAAIPGAIVNFAFRNKSFRYIRFHSKERRQMNYYSNLMVNKDAAQENKILGLGDTYLERYKAVFAKYYRGLKRLMVKEGLTQIVVGLISVVVQCLLFAYVAYSVIVGNGQIGDYSLYSGALTSVVSYVSTILAASVTIYEGTLFIDNMMTFMREEPHVLPAVAEPPHIERGAHHTIELRDVSFAYPGTDKKVLDHMDLKLETGESVVVVGLNGAGKSTLIKLLTRLYDPTEGVILFDGRDLRDYDPKEYYSIFGIIFQNFVHYAESAEDNVRFGDMNAEYSRSAVELAATRSGAADFIERLPNGYDTPLTRIFEENGIELSGGQWQKLSVARAFYKESDILILDEPTAALDPLAEQEVFDRYTELACGKLSIFVSHKLSSAVSADRIIVIDGGRIAESGSHEELMKKKGRYFDLFSVQAHRYTGVDVTASSATTCRENEDLSANKDA